MLLFGLMCLLTTGLTLFSQPVEAEVLVQGEWLADEDYYQLLDSIPEDCELVSNEEYRMMQMQRADAVFLSRGHVQDIGWQDWRGSGKTAGTTGQNKCLEAIRVMISGSRYGISYQTHIQDIGWTHWVSSSTSEWSAPMSGTTGQSKRMEAIKWKIFKRR
ncbi:hypothetical protein RV18_GL000492 [Enterococcus termitis]|nr:hypothetical protein RV18_GL000492 [Enterococcus termitis]